MISGGVACSVKANSAALEEQMNFCISLCDKKKLLAFLLNQLQVLCGTNLAMAMSFSLYYPVFY